jgi:hypothetical protein
LILSVANPCLAAPRPAITVLSLYYTKSKSKPAKSGRLWIHPVAIVFVRGQPATPFTH